MNKCRVMKLNVPNINGRIYTEEVVINNIINDPVVKEQIANKCCFIFDEPEMGFMNVIGIGIVENIYIETENDDKYLAIDYVFLDTVKGKLYKTLDNIEITINGQENVNNSNIVENYTFNSFYASLRGV